MICEQADNRGLRMRGGAAYPDTNATGTRSFPAGFRVTLLMRNAIQEEDEERATHRDASFYLYRVYNLTRLKSEGRHKYIGLIIGYLERTQYSPNPKPSQSPITEKIRPSAIYEIQ